MPPSTLYSLRMKAIQAKVCGRCSENTTPTKHRGWEVHLRLVLSALCLLIITQTARGEDVLATLRKGHPRLMVLDEDLTRVKQLIASDPIARQWHDALVVRAERVLGQPPVEHVLIGPRLLDKSRTALDRISLLAGLYRLNGDRRFAERAKREMLAVCAFADWNPKHFLDTAEMSNAVGIGYDWLYDTFTPEERATFRRAIVELGLKQALPIYEKNTWWANVHHNWNQVCNGGITVGALAIADEEPAMARRVVEFSRQSIPRAMASYAPDGGWAEGPGYWSYATTYNVYYLAAVQTALGTDFGLSKLPGFADAGLFRIHAIGPIGLTFNYADAGTNGGKAPCMFWLARQFDRPVYAAHERVVGGSQPAGIFDLLWFSAAGKSVKETVVPTGALFRGVNVAFFRSAWDDPKAMYVGFKGGDNQANHAHLDLGTFVLDDEGYRFAEDLGGDYYNLPGYFGKQRWSYYRLRTEGHNTLVVNGENQDTDGKAPIVAFHDAPDRAFAVADLSAAYKKTLSKWWRGVEVLDGRRLLVRDEVQATSPAEVVWNFHTKAKVEVAADGASALLTQKMLSEKEKAELKERYRNAGGAGPEEQVAKGQGAALRARILSPAGARFEVVSAEPPAPQNPNPGGVNLVVKLPSKVTAATIAVLFSPVGDDETPKQGPLSAWVEAGRVK